MAAGFWTLTDEGVTKFLNGEWLDADTYKVALFLSTSNIGPSSTTYAGLTNEHANNHGYATGGKSITLSRTGTRTVTLGSTNPLPWTASGGSIVARWAVIYEVGGRVLAYALLDATPGDITIASGDDLSLILSAGIIQASTP